MTAEHEAERDHRTDPEAEEIQREQDNPGHADRDGNADALDDRLHREPFADGTTWNAALIDVRVVPSVAAMSVIRSTPASTNRPNEAAPGPVTITAITASTAATAAGLRPAQGAGRIAASTGRPGTPGRGCPRG